MRILYDQRVLQEIQGLAPGPRAAVRTALAALRAHDGDRPPGLDVRRLEWPTPIFRIKTGSYRIVFAWQLGAHRILKVFHRSEGYGWLERMG